MRNRSAKILGVLAVAAVVASPALAFRGGSTGGDREPAGGAFMSSFSDQSSQQAYGPPRSVDIPRNGYYHQGERYVPYGHGQRPRYRTW